MEVELEVSGLDLGFGMMTILELVDFIGDIGGPIQYVRNF